MVDLAGILGVTDGPAAGPLRLVERIPNIWGFAQEVWKDDNDAREFLFGRHVMLDDRRPIDVAIESELGAELVRNILGGLLYGTAV